MTAFVDNHDFRVRQTAFEFLEKLTALHGEVVPRTKLEAGFQYRDERVPLLSPAGIFKPAILEEIPLTITTVPIKPGKPRPYDDEIGKDGSIRYRYRGENPNHRDNVGLRQACKRRVPLIYFYGVVPGQYLPFWPVYIVGDDPESLTFQVQVDDLAQVYLARPDTLAEAGEQARRRYITVTAQRRMHQHGFRERVLRAYREACSICELRHRELLEAAHIIPDSDPRGTPEVSNGLALCKLHHAAFDRNVLGIRSDLRIHIRQDILEEEDGPMLRHGLQGFQDMLIHVPRSTALRPNPEYLAERYELFRSA